MATSEYLYNVISSAPNQNRDQFDTHLERLVPYFAAIALNRIISMTLNTEPLYIDMWNSFGHHMDQSYKNQTRFDSVSRKEYSTLLLNEKYKFFEDHEIDTSQHVVICDDDPDTISWVTDKIEDLCEDGTIYEDDESVNVCMTCGNVIAIAASNVSACARCDSVRLSVEKRQLLFMDLPGNNLDYIQGKVSLPKKAAFLNGQFATLPNRIFITKMRDYGQPLGIKGYEDMVLDPKIGLALMPEMVAEKYHIETFTQVQGATTAKNTVPYTSILSPSLINRYIFTSNIPSDINEKKLSELGVMFFTKYLPIYMLDRVGNIDESQLESLRVEHSKTKRKIENALNYLRTHASDFTPNTSKDSSLLTQGIGRIATYNIRQGVLDTRKFVYEDLGGQYVRDSKEKNEVVSSSDLEDIESKLWEIY
jgi:hypothetical protein